MSTVTVTREECPIQIWEFTLITDTLLVLSGYLVRKSRRHMPEVIYSRATDSSEALKDVPFPDDVKQEALLRYVLMLKVMKD